jgi:hypothetical protein
MMTGGGDGVRHKAAGGPSVRNAQDSSDACTTVVTSALLCGVRTLQNLGWFMLDEQKALMIAFPASGTVNCTFIPYEGLLQNTECRGSRHVSILHNSLSSVKLRFWRA